MAVNYAKDPLPMCLEEEKKKKAVFLQMKAKPHLKLKTDQSGGSLINIYYLLQCYM